MASSVIGALRVTLGLDSAQFSAGATKAENRAEQLGFKIGRSMRSAAGEVSTFAKVFAGLGAVAGAAELGSLASKGLEYASSLGEVAQQLGVTTKDLQEYRYAATQVGISQEEIDKGLAKLTVSMGQARDGVKKPVAAFRELSDLLGKDVLQNAATAGDAIPLIADALAKVQDPAQRAAIEVALFGKTGQRLDTLLSGGSEAIDGLRDAAQRMGVVLSDKQIADADQTADRLSDLKQVLEANIAGAVANNATAIYDLANAFSQLATSAINAQAPMTGLFRIISKDGIGAGVRSFFGSGKDQIAAQSEQGYAKLKVQQFRDAVKKYRNQKVVGYERPDAQGVLDAYKAAQGAVKAFAASQRRKPTMPATLTPAGAGTATTTGGGNGGGRSGTDRLAREQQRAHEKALRNEKEFMRDLARSQNDQLSAQLDLTVDQTERFKIQRELLTHERDSQIEAIRSDQDMKDAHKQQLIASIQKTAVMKGELLARENSELIAKQSLDAAIARNDNEQQLLTAQANLARTSKERGVLELKILDLQFEQLRLAQQDILGRESSSPDEKAIARESLAMLGTLQRLAQQKAQRDNLGPLGSFLDSLPQTAAEANEALESVAADGVKSLVDGIGDAIAGAHSLADVFDSVSKQIVAALIRIGIQRAIVGPLESLLGAGASSAPASLGASISAGSSHALDFLSGARALGGPVIGGKSYVVGERGPELFTAPHSGNILPNDALGGRTPAVVQLVVGEGHAFEARVRSISGDVAIETVADSNRKQALARERALAG
ncbi:conserved hypothetical protein [Sphingomonas sp. EC-HK361]|uniref:hypothetical protein n=1 Tax=Sphingomonas sp. EC-HK361 TaxID=2038397 RepID=UPI00125533AA|nr:hypothetical protein [Sphingomonas sp. EC-HK361]VVT16376.1 conserved hypothetical protein [Sphingomonas sp. EC-HK361]